MTDLQDAFTGLGASKGFGLELAFVVGLLVSIAVVCAIWAIGVLGMPRAGRGSRAVSSAAASRTR